MAQKQVSLLSSPPLIALYWSANVSLVLVLPCQSYHVIRISKIWSGKDVDGGRRLRPVTLAPLFQEGFVWKTPCRSHISAPHHITLNSPPRKPPMSCLTAPHIHHTSPRFKPPVETSQHSSHPTTPQTTWYHLRQNQPLHNLALSHP